MSTKIVEKKTETTNEYFGHLTDRIAHYRESVLTTKPYVCAERAVLATQAYQQSRSACRIETCLHVEEHLGKHDDLYRR